MMDDVKPSPWELAFSIIGIVLIISFLVFVGIISMGPKSKTRRGPWIDKNAAALWVLVIFVGYVCIPLLFRVPDDLHSNAQIGAVLWDVFCAVVSAAAGLFLIRRFLGLVDDNQCYERREEERWKEQQGR
jgi:hypothetical protein